MACRQSLTPTGWVLYPARVYHSRRVHYSAGKDYHPQKGVTVSQELFTTLRNGSLPCMRLLLSGRVQYPAGG
jgi:hypothetical protein